MKNVVIIGAGPAGLTAAYELLQRAPKEYSITILEESNAIGGISKTVKYKNNRMDIGGHRFFSKDQQVMDWWQKMMPRQGKPSFDDIKLHREKKLAAGGPDPEKTDRVMLVRNRVSRIYYKHKFFDYPVSLKWDTIKNMGFATTVAAGCSYLKSTIGKKEESFWKTSISIVSAKSCIPCSSRATPKSCGVAIREKSPQTGARSVSRACPSLPLSRICSPS